jgi:hypothetical protein
MSNKNKHSQQETPQEIKFLISPYFSEQEAISHFLYLLKDPQTSKSIINKNTQRDLIFQVKTAFRKDPQTCNKAS